jgi:8-oxo-dGTP diphosphatase
MSGPPKTPLITVDVIIEIGDGIVLIERKHPPPGWALPGGFVDPGEPLWKAAVREAKEETLLDVKLEEQFFAYSDPRRDDRGHAVSVVFLGRAEGTPRAADDAKNVRIFQPDELPPLAFDHGIIVADWRRYRATGKRPEWSR